MACRSWLEGNGYLAARGHFPKWAKHVGMLLEKGPFGDTEWTYEVNRASKKSRIPWVLQVNGEPKPILHGFYSEEAAKPG